MLLIECILRLLFVGGIISTLKFLGVGSVSCNDCECYSNISAQLVEQNLSHQHRKEEGHKTNFLLTSLSHDRVVGNICHQSFECAGQYSINGHLKDLFNLNTCMLLKGSKELVYPTDQPVYLSYLTLSTLKTESDSMENIRYAKGVQTS